MKHRRGIFLGAVLILFIPAVLCPAQVPGAARQIAEAVLPAPVELREGAAVLGYDAGIQLVTLREGTKPAAVYNVAVALENFDPATATVTLFAVYIPYATPATTGLSERPGPPAPRGSCVREPLRPTS